MNGAELVLHTLQQHNIDSVFGYPGGAIMPIYDALYDSEINHYLCRHEQGAGFAALGYARSSGKTGVCFATSGPGATNLITALADAKLDSVPLVAITGQVASQVMGTDAFQEVDVLGLSLTVTKHSFLVESVEQLADTLKAAIALAHDGRPGPVLVDIPKDIQLAHIDGKELDEEMLDEKPLINNAPANYNAQPQHAPQLMTTTPDPSDLSKRLQQAAKLMSDAQRPLLYIGGGVHMAKAKEEFNALLNAAKWPVVSTLKALGTVATDYPLDLGMLGMHGSQAANYTVQACDLLMCIGARFDDRVTGKLDEFAADATVIHCDIDAAEINKLRAADVAFVEPFKHLLPQLTAGLLASNDKQIDLTPWQQQVESWQRTYAWNYDQVSTATPNAQEDDGVTSKIDGPHFLKQLSDTLPSNKVVCCDVGQHQMWVAQHMQFAQPSDHLTSGGLGTMGFGLPAAIGAQLARTGDTVVAVSGDGSFMMNVQELATIKRFGLPVKIIIMDNSRLGMVKQWQELFFDKRFSHTDLSDNPDFVQLAAAFDIPGLTIDSSQDIPQALEAMLSWQGAFLLHVKINETDNVWPLVPPNRPNHEMLTELTQ
ncbi:acetolactate synthase 2 catalytic subunit [Flocculibacter collagenilyticus]|uniref:acetolactate synthase 2 catalytic subunit n=1 Tax=Flocculibacter collagenilyticus TaxID=2744479 RepID=UPI0018F5833A|nr:acetolactate synthase 2 catalytic subunit [Flocculibacter collagenilyticus]